MKLGEVCIHGSLRRSCEACEIGDEYQTLAKAADALAKEVKDLSGDFLLMRDAQIAEIVAQRSQLPYFQRGVRYLLEALAAYEKVRNGKYE